MMIAVSVPDFIRMLARLFVLLFWCAFFSGSTATAQTFLEVEKAFPVRVFAMPGDPSVWTVEFAVAEGYYLYRDKLGVQRVEGDQGAQPRVDIPAGKRKFDENLGKEVETLRNTVTLTVHWSDAPPSAIDVLSQGCADAGLCYPPQVQRLKPARAGGGAGAWSFGLPFSSTADSSQASTQTAAQAAPGLSLDESGSLAQRLQNERPVWVLAAFFGLGVLLAFTPCVLPMVPILSAVIVGQQANAQSANTQSANATASRRLRSLALAAAYVAGMSLVYTLVGVVAGLTGEGLVAHLQTPAVLYTFAAFLLVFGIAMLNGWNMQLPLALQNWVNDRSSRLQGGRFMPVFVMGGLSAVLVGPCVAPPLAGALIYLSTTGDWMLGGAALMALSWGLGAPLIVAAAAADRLLPKAGMWMESVKRFFGFLLIALAIYTAAPVISTRLLMGLWCVFLLVSAAWAGALQTLPMQAGAVAKLRQGFAWVMLLAGVLQGVGAAIGSDDVFNPLAPLVRSSGPSVTNPTGMQDSGNAGRVPDASRVDNAIGSSNAVSGLSNHPSSGPTAAGAFSNPHGLPFRRVAAADVASVVASLGQPAFLDFYADWCVSCKEMERFTFTDAGVQAALKGVVWLQVDVTANTPDDRALLKRYRLFGPPGIVFFDAQGAEISGARVVGFQDAKTFEKTVRGIYGHMR